jgi:RHS repeat-associated protein
VVAEIIRTPTGDQTLYFHPDALGTPETLTDASGNVSHQAFNPFGTRRDGPGGPATRIGYTGHHQDDDLGLIDMGGRVYDPLAARFTTADPIMQAPYWSQGQNRYAYVLNDPINMTDPSGFQWQDTGSTGGNVAWGIGAAAWGGTAAYAAGSAAGLSLPATMSGFMPAASGLGAAGGLGGGAANALGTLLGNPFGGSSGGSFNLAAPSGTPNASPVKPGGTNAVGQGSPPRVVQEGGFAPQGAAPGAGASPQAPFVKDGRITGAGRNILRRTFDRYNFDVDQIKVIFKKNLGQAGITLGNRVYLDDSFQYLSPYRQMRLLAHEITHSVQYRDLGKANFLERYAVGYKQVDNYDIPTELWAVPTNKLSVTQAGSYLGQDGMRYDFTLDQIAERIGVETASGLPYP